MITNTGTKINTSSLTCVQVLSLTFQLVGLGLAPDLQAYDNEREEWDSLPMSARKLEEMNWPMTSRIVLPIEVVMPRKES